ncbi:polyketide cyclase [Mesorhizobium sp. CU2]|uniref:nuclear transport factor 2 family protein n=1 Tax=unclassified Mesorhizobium TaxID=325217 RepID=UPI0011294F2D|nr:MULTISPECIES: nuclear transport factor 2 family protein [unclassified Mesorhizobium]TPN85651.1 polyketide cyclase [Mesorhizobium sp. CU3]TPO11008.1 polyketide cyclase [Mesorhizobium sp. CU2]
MTNASSVEANKKVVVGFLETVFDKHEVDAGIDRFMGPVYTQHNPGVPDGREAFRAFFLDFFSTRPNARFKIKRVFCEGDFVTVHAHWTEHEGDRGSAVMDIFRVENGRVVEHWDVIQPIPEQLAHSNTMF